MSLIKYSLNHLSNCCILIKSTSSNKFVFIIMSTNSSCSRYPFPFASAMFIISLTSFSFRFKSTSWHNFLRSSTVRPPFPWNVIQMTVLKRQRSCLSVWWETTFSCGSISWDQNRTVKTSIPVSQGAKEAPLERAVWADQVNVKLHFH